MNILLTLNINKYDYLQFITDVDDNNFIDLNNTFMSAWLKQRDSMICINTISVGFELDKYAYHMQQCLDNQISIQKELGKDIDLGLLWNENWQKISLAEDAGKPLENWDWIADNTIFLQCKTNSNNSCNTFLYNDEQGNIIFEISAAYPWFFEDAPSPELNISYDDWLPKYKILYKTTISRKVAQQWVKQFNELYEKLDANMICCKK